MLLFVPYALLVQDCFVRYGWVNSTELVIVRHKANPLCARNQTGIIRKVPDGKKYDAFCYNDEDLSVKNCKDEIIPEISNKTDANPVTASTAMNTEITTLQQNTGVEDNETSTSEVLSDTSVSTAVPWTQNPEEYDETDPTSVSTAVSWTPNSEEYDETVQMHDTNYTEPIEESTTLQPNADITGPGTGERTSTHETPANQTGHVNPNNRSSGSDMTRSADWLIILLTILAVLLILLICIMVATRKRWCGRKKTLIITKEGSSKENGASASFSQEPEMVTLVNS
ncbi:CD44 antigen isoform X2 [Pseudorasbora parva]|uniref:CD44 antigen isoform X2 n=1 Tax=Pseudorasbora parva TaxID=51549 RepID=UPI00351DDBE5